MADPLVWWCIPGVRRGVSREPGGVKSGIATYCPRRPAVELPTLCVSGHVGRIPSPPCPQPTVQEVALSQATPTSTAAWWSKLPMSSSSWQRRVSSWRSEMTGSSVPPRSCVGKVTWLAMVWEEIYVCVLGLMHRFFFVVLTLSRNLCSYSLMIESPINIVFLLFLFGKDLGSITNNDILKLFSKVLPLKLHKFALVQSQ